MLRGMLKCGLQPQLANNLSSSRIRSELNRVILSHSFEYRCVVTLNTIDLLACDVILCRNIIQFFTACECVEFWLKNIYYFKSTRIYLICMTSRN